MTAKIDKYISVFNIGLQNTFVYRWNYFLRALFGLIPLAGTVFLWRAIFKERGGGLHGYDYGSMIYYCLLLRIFPRRPDVSHRYHAHGSPGSDEMAAVLLRTFLPDCDLSRTASRCGPGAGTRHSKWLAVVNLGRRARHVETRPRPLPGRRRLSLRALWRRLCQTPHRETHSPRRAPPQHYFFA